MIISSLSAPPSPLGNRHSETAIITIDARDLEALVRGLAGDFPLHSASELRRTIIDAEDDLWPHKDPVDILDRARERLREGVLG